jgi:hypothetical protein
MCRRVFGGGALILVVAFSSSLVSFGQSVDQRDRGPFYVYSSTQTVDQLVAFFYRPSLTASQQREAAAAIEQINPVLYQGLPRRSDTPIPVDTLVVLPDRSMIIPTSTSLDSFGWLTQEIASQALADFGPNRMDSALKSLFLDRLNYEAEETRPRRLRPGQPLYVMNSGDPQLFKARNVPTSTIPQSAFALDHTTRDSVLRQLIFNGRSFSWQQF